MSKHTNTGKRTKQAAKNSHKHEHIPTTTRTCLNCDWRKDVKCTLLDAPATELCDLWAEVKSVRRKPTGFQPGNQCARKDVLKCGRCFRMVKREHINTDATFPNRCIDCVRELRYKRDNPAPARCRGCGTRGQNLERSRYCFECYEKKLANATLQARKRATHEAEAFKRERAARMAHLVNERREELSQRADIGLQTSPVFKSKHLQGATRVTENTQNEDGSDT